MANGNTEETYKTSVQCVSLIHAAVTTQDSSLKCTKVIQRKIRVRLLDCRSGEPLKDYPVEKVLIDGEPAVRFLGDPDWDIVGNYLVPVNGPGDPINSTGFTASNRSKLQKLLEALGYDCGTPGKQFGDQSWKALQAFQENWFLAHPDEEKPARFEKKVTVEWQKRIITEYNLRFYRTAQFYLSALGYPCSADDGKWKEASKKAFQRWQKVELEFKGPNSIFMSTNANRAQKLKDAKKTFFSDPNGDIYIPVPVAKIRDGFKLKVSFRDFAIVAEQKDWRSSSEQRPTGFLVEFVDSQNPNSGNWGWRLRSSGNSGSLSASLPQFKAFLEFNVPAAPDYKWSKLTDAQLAGASFSPFYKNMPSDQPEITIFALVWCQPVWDGIADPAPPSMLGAKAFIQANGERNRNMHIVTTYFDGGGWDAYGGKGYGLYEYSENPRYRGKDPGAVKDGHRGLDLHAFVGGKIFAVHGGTVKRFSSTGDAGNYVRLSWTGTGQKSISYLHLSAFESADNTRVRAGEIVGLAGRSGNLGDVSRWPGHVHINVGPQVALRSTPDAANKVSIPYDSTPLLLPCHCAVTLATENPSGCNFSNTKFAGACWAVAELKCPHMNAAGQENRRLQAQLRYVYEHYAVGPFAEGEEPPYLNPGPLDGGIGAVPATPAAAGKTRKAIRTFRLAQGLSESYEMDAVAWQRLNEMAPVTAAAD